MSHDQSRDMEEEARDIMARFVEAVEHRRFSSHGWTYFLVELIIKIGVKMDDPEQYAEKVFQAVRIRLGVITPREAEDELTLYRANKR